MTEIKVLCKGFVRLIDSMGDDLSVVNSARVSFGKEKKKIDPSDEKLIAYLWEHNHTSPFRHAFVKFHIKAPIFVLRQWMKHQVGCSWNELSGRYVQFSGEFYLPNVWRQQHQNNKQGSTGEIEDQQSAMMLYKTQVEKSVSSYYDLLKIGVCKEQARMILPQSLYTECIWSCSLQAVMHFLQLRDDEHSQYEIQQYAKVIRELITPLFPISLSLQQKDNTNE